MCEPASMIVTKKKVFWSLKTESHHEIISEFGLKEKDVRGNYTLVPIEITPPVNDFRLPLSKWQFRIDHAGYKHELPNWWDEKKEEKRVRIALKEWRKAKIIMPNESRNNIIDGQVIAIYGTVEYIRGGTVKYIEGGTVEYIRGGTVEYIRGGTVKSIEGGTVKYIEGGTVEYIRGGTVEYIEGGTVESIEGGTVESIEGGTVEYIRGDFPKNIKGNPTIISYGSLTPDILQSSKAVLIDRSKDTVVCYVGKDN